MEPRSASARIARQRHVIAQMMTALGMEPTNIGKLSGVGGSTISRALKPDSTNLWRAGTIERLRDFAAERGYALDVAELTLRDAQGREVPVGDEPIGRPRRSGADIVAADIVAAASATGAAASATGADGGRDGGASGHAVPVRAAAPAGETIPVSGRVVDVHATDAAALVGRADGMAMDDFLRPDDPDTIACPPWLLGVDGAYALRVTGHGLSPVLRRGDYVYVMPRRDGLDTDDVVVVGTRDGVVSVGLLATRSADALRLRIMSGAPDEEIPAASVTYVHRVVGIRRD